MWRHTNLKKPLRLWSWGKRSHARSTKCQGFPRKHCETQSSVRHTTERISAWLLSRDCYAPVQSVSQLQKECVYSSLDNDPGLRLNMFQGSSFSSTFAQKDSELLRRKLLREFPSYSWTVLTSFFHPRIKGVCLPVNLWSVSKAKNDTVCVPINA